MQSCRGPKLGSLIYARNCILLILYFALKQTIRLWTYKIFPYLTLLMDRDNILYRIEQCRKHFDHCGLPCLNSL